MGLPCGVTNVALIFLALVVSAGVALKRAADTDDETADITHQQEVLPGPEGEGEATSKDEAHKKATKAYPTGIKVRQAAAPSSPDSSLSAGLQCDCKNCVLLQQRTTAQSSHAVWTVKPTTSTNTRLAHSSPAGVHVLPRVDWASRPPIQHVGCLIHLLCAFSVSFKPLCTLIETSYTSLDVCQHVGSQQQH